MLQRKVTKRLVKWKNESSKALLVIGARQSGKSYAIREFGKSSYSCYFEVSLLLDKAAKSTLASAESAVDFIFMSLRFAMMASGLDR